MNRKEKRAYLEAVEKKMILFMNEPIPNSIKTRLYSELPASMFYDSKENETLCSSCGKTFPGKPEMRKVEKEGLGWDGMHKYFVTECTCAICKATGEFKEARRYKRAMIHQEAFVKFTRRDKNGLCIMCATLFNIAYPPEEGKKMEMGRIEHIFAAQYKDEKGSTNIKKSNYYPNDKYRLGKLNYVENYTKPFSYYSNVIRIEDMKSAYESIRRHKKSFIRNIDMRVIEIYGDLFRYDPFAERLCRTGLRKICSAYLSGQRISFPKRSILTQEQFFELPKIAIKAMRKHDVSYETWRKMVDLNKKKNGITAQDWDAYAETFEHLGRYNTFTFGTVDVTPFLPVRRIVDMNSGNWERWSTFFFDYIKTAKKLGMDITDKRVLSPTDIKVAHDRVTEEYTKDCYKGADIRISRIIESLVNLEDQNQKFIIRLPRTSLDIVKEGTILHHCVKTYIDRYADEETIILFLRRAEDPETPFVTIEYRDGKIVQARGDHNSNPPQDAKKYLETWEKKQNIRAPKRREKALKAA